MNLFEGLTAPDSGMERENTAQRRSEVVGRPTTSIGTSDNGPRKCITNYICHVQTQLF